MTDPLLVAFVGGPDGPWRLDGMTAPAGEPLRPVAHLAVVEGPDAGSAAGTWALRGVAGPERYGLGMAGDGGPPPLGRPEARCAALVAVRKSPAWWDMGSSERRALLEDRSRRVAAGMEDPPTVADRLHHSRDLDEPFDFLVWYEFEPADQDAFNDFLALMRGTEEWTFVEREVDIRLSR